MASLVHCQSGYRVELAADTLVGRSRACLLVIERPWVSSLHARLRWSHTGWAIQDLSRNGTWLNTRQLERDSWNPLKLGDLVAFGQTKEPWQLVCDAQPLPAIIPCDGGSPIPLGRQPVALPSEDEAAASLWLDQDGFIVFETPKQRLSLTDSQVVTVGERTYRVQAPFSLPPTAQTAPSLAEATLQLRVAGHEEHIEARLLVAHQVIHLRSRTHFQLLLLLARERLGDQARAIPLPDQGWLTITDLCDLLKTDRAAINTHVYRLRKQFGHLDLRDAVEIVQRRFDSDEIRLGCPSIQLLGSLP